jgi:hypothetical protein
VLFVLALVVEGHDVEVAEAGRQFGYRGDTHADMVFAHTCAVMVAVLVKKLFDLQVR